MKEFNNYSHTLCLKILKYQTNTDIYIYILDFRLMKSNITIILEVNTSFKE
jgi:hypothetical protein